MKEKWIMRHKGTCGLSTGKETSENISAHHWEEGVRRQHYQECALPPVGKKGLITGRLPEDK